MVIWTTTPWTLPANLAIAVHPHEKYSKIRAEGRFYWVAEKLASQFIDACGLLDTEHTETKSGADFKGIIVCIHLLSEEPNTFRRVCYNGFGWDVSILLQSWFG